MESKQTIERVTLHWSWWFDLSCLANRILFSVSATYFALLLVIIVYSSLQWDLPLLTSWKGSLSRIACLMSPTKFFFKSCCHNLRSDFRKAQRGAARIHHRTWPTATFRFHFTIDDKLLQRGKENMTRRDSWFLIERSYRPCLCFSS